MNRIKNTLTILTLFLLGTCFAQNRVRSSEYNKMLENLLSHNVTEVSVMQLTSDTNKVIFLDARERKEYNVSHLKDAIWVGYDTFSMSEVKKIDKNAKIIVYCSVGYRSEKITKRLSKKGFVDVKNLYGGIFEWKNQGNKVYQGAEETEEVHAYDRNWGKWLNKGVKIY